MKTIGFVILMAAASAFIGLIGSVILGIVALIHSSIQRVFGRFLALAVVTFVNSFVMVGWTAWVMLWIERGTPPYDPSWWAALLMGAFLITAPVGIARRSTLGIANEIGLTTEQADLLISLNYIAIIQMLAAALMYFDRPALHWWRWLPFSS